MTTKQQRVSIADAQKAMDKAFPTNGKVVKLKTDPERIDLDQDLVQVVAQASQVQAQLQRDLTMFLKGKGYTSSYELRVENGVPFLVRQKPAQNGHKVPVG